jgi:hypothetical protein
MKHSLLRFQSATDPAAIRGRQWLLTIGVAILAFEFFALRLLAQTPTGPTGSSTLSPEETKQLQQLFLEISQQRAELDANRNNIAEKIAVIGEDIRQARIFSAKATR